MVRSANISSFCNRSFAMAIALSIGTLVNNEMTSNDTRIIPLGSVGSFMKVQNSKELATFDEEFLTRGDKIVTKYFESLFMYFW